VQVATPKGFLHVAELPIENADDFARWLLESYDLDGETVMVTCWILLSWVGLNQVSIAYVLRKKN
jgi:aspartate aminotransferase